MQERRFALLGKNHDGFTLIEVMIVVVVVAILAAIAYPSYTSYVRKARRADAEQQLLTLAQLNQQRFLDTRAYTSTVSNLVAIPSNVSAHYNISIALVTGPPAGFSVSAAPYGAQASDTCGQLNLYDSGRKTVGTVGSDVENTTCW